MKKTLAIISAFIVSAALSGCISSAPPQCANWTLERSLGTKTALSVTKTKTDARLLQVNVRSPWDSRAIAVLRPDGSLAFDPYNHFASSPASLLRGIAEDALADTGMFDAVYPSASSARTETDLELTVTKMALDCRIEGERKAVVEISLTVVKRRRGVKTVQGRGECPATDGDYSRAFSQAFLTAAGECAGKL